MKKSMLSLLLVLCLMTALVLPARAANYEKLSDETDRMDQETLKEYGNNLLPMFVDLYGLDVRVDILPVAPEKEWDATMGEYIYDKYEYGAGPGKNGISLTILIYEDETGFTLNQWYLYAGGDSAELKETAVSALTPQLEPLLTPECFQGDLESDMEAVNMAVQVFTVATEEYILEGHLSSTIYDPATNTKLPTEAPVVTEVPEDTEAVEATEAPEGTEEVPYEIPEVFYVYDNAMVMDFDTVLKLNQKADSIIQKYQAGVYFVDVSDFRDVAGDATIEEAAENCYAGLELGVGPQKDGILLLVSTDTREYIIMVKGSLEETLGKPGTEFLEQQFLPFLKNSDWSGAVNAMMEGAATLLEQNAQGHPIAKEAAKTPAAAYAIGIVVCLAIAFLIALLVVHILKNQLRSVAQKVEAKDYLTGNGADIQESYDRFTHTTRTRTYDPPQKAPSESKNSSGSNSSNSSSGTF